jgi:hypothetical protein
MLLIKKTPINKEICKLPSGLEVIKYLEQHDNASEIRPDVYLNNELLTEHDDFKRVVGDDDALLINYMPHGLDPITLTIIFVVTAVALISLIPEPEIPNAAGETNTSPNNQISGQKNTVRKYEGIPNIYGRVWSYPDLIANAVPEWISNRKQVRELFLIGEGKYTINQVRDGTTDVSDISNTEATAYYVPEDGAPTDLYRIRFQDEVDGEEALAPDDESIIWNGDAVFFAIAFFINSVDSGTFTAPSTIVLDGVSSGLGNAILPAVGETFSISNTTSNDGTFTVNSISESLGVYTIIVDELTVVSESNTDFFLTLTERDKIAPKDITIVSQLGLSVGDQFTTTTSGNLGPYTIAGIFISDSDATFFLDYGDTVTNAGTFETNIQEFGGGGTYNTIGPFSMPTTAEEIWFNLSAPRGLRTDSGGTATITVTCYVQETDGMGGDIGAPITQNAVFAGNTLSEFGQTVKFTGLGGIYADVYVIRTTNRYTGNATDYVQWDECFTVNSYDGSNFGDVTVLDVTAKTSVTGSTSSRKINADVTRQIDNIETTNFADAVVNLIETKGNRDSSTINTTELYEIADSISDDLKEFSYTFDDKDISLGQAVQTACNVARVTAYLDGQTWRFNRDEAKDRTYVFNRRNLASGDNQKQTFQRRQPQSYDSVVLSYYSRSDETRDDVLIKIDSDTSSFIVGEAGARPYEIDLAGCANYDQALNRAHLEARKIVYQTRRVEDVALNDIFNVDVGDRVAWCDIYDGDTFDGEITGVNGDIYSTSEKFTPEDGVTYYVLVTDEFGVSMTPAVAVAVDGNEFAFEATLTESPNIADGFTIQAGSKYIIGSIDDIEDTDFSLVSRSSNDENGRVSFELIQYSDNIYEMDT